MDPSGPRGPVQLHPRTDPLLAARIGAAWTELRRGAAMAVLREHLFGSGPDALEPGQVDTLELLAKQPSWRMSELAESLRVDPSTATRAVQRLEAAGLADRTPDTADKRVVMVSATPAGRSRLRRIDDLRRATLPAMLASFDEHELALFAEFLERFVAGLDQFVQELDPDA